MVPDYTASRPAHRLRLINACRAVDLLTALSHSNYRQKLSKYLLLPVLAFCLASCGEREPDSIEVKFNSSSSSSGNAGGLGGYFGTGCKDRSAMQESPTGICLPMGNTSGSADSAPTPLPAPVPRTANIGKFVEFEPNDSPVNATPVAFPSRLGADVVGIEIAGSALDVSDPADYFVLTAASTKTYFIYLCEDTCMDHPTDNKVAIRVFDESLNLIAGNPLHGDSTKFVTANLDAGLTYYVQIVAIGTGNLAYPYRLVVIE